MSSFGLHDEIFGLYDSSPDGNLFEDDLKELMKLQSVSSDSMVSFDFLILFKFLL